MVNRILFFVPLSILIFVLVAPIILRALFPGFENTNFRWRPLGKACVGIVIPKDKYPFILKKTIFFDRYDFNANNQCFGVDLYYKE